MPIRLVLLLCSANFSLDLKFLIDITLNKSASHVAGMISDM